MGKKRLILLVIVSVILLAAVFGTVYILRTLGAEEIDSNPPTGDPDTSEPESEDGDADGTQNTAPDEDGASDGEPDTDDTRTEERPERLPDSTDEEPTTDGEATTDSDGADVEDEEPDATNPDASLGDGEGDFDNGGTTEENGGNGIGEENGEESDSTEEEKPQPIGISTIGINKNGELFVMFTDGRAQVYEDSVIKADMSITSASVTEDGLVTVVFSNGESVSFQKRK